MGAGYFKRINKRSNAKLKQIGITFDTQLKIALSGQPFSIVRHLAPVYSTNLKVASSNDPTFIVEKGRLMK